MACCRAPAPSRAPFEEVEHLLSTVNVPVRSRSLLESDPCCAQLAIFISGYRLEVCSAGEVISCPIVPLYVIDVPEI